MIRNIDKIAMAKVVRSLSPINLNSKFMQAISNIDINATRNLGLVTSIKKNQRLAG